MGSLNQQTISFTAPDVRILMVDDDAINRKVFSALLKKTEVQITGAAGGEEAIKLASEKEYDMIFMDYCMPGMDGMEAMKQIKAHREWPSGNTPIFVLTADTFKNTQQQYLDEGFDGFLSKPLDPEELKGCIFSRLSRKAQESEEKEQGDQDISDLPPIFGLDWDAAMMRMQKKEILLSTLRDFEQAIDLQADELQNLWDMLPDTIEEYRIRVHGMKSAAALVGMIPLSGMAEVLERAAAETDYDTIKSLHHVFLREWRSYKERLSVIAKEDRDEKQEDVQISQLGLNALLDMIGDAMEEMDIDTADHAVRKLSAYRLPENTQTELETLKRAVFQLDTDLANDTIGKMKQAI